MFELVDFLEDWLLCECVDASDGESISDSTYEFKASASSVPPSGPLASDLAFEGFSLGEGESETLPPFFPLSLNFAMV